MKKILALFMSIMMVFSLAGCGSKETKKEGKTETEDTTGAASEFDFTDVKIGVLGYMQSGETLDAMTAYLDALSEEVGFTYEYVAGSSYDEQTNITAVQNLIASGVDGIILAMDSGTSSIIKECESAGVYLAGFVTDFDRSFDSIKANPYFLGNVCDGKYNQSEIGGRAAELLISDGNKKAGIVTFPLNYFPHKKEAIDEFANKIEEYNKTAAETIEIYDTQELSFTQLEDTYFKTYPEIDSIFGLASGYIYSTMVSAGKTDVDLYYTGYKKDDIAAFEKGDIRMMTLSNIEALSYPLAMILNQVSDMPYADKPQEAERVDTSIVFVTNNDELKALQEKCLYYTTDMEQSFISAEGFKQYLTAFNPDAKYAELKEVLMHMSMEDIMAK